MACVTEHRIGTDAYNYLLYALRMYCTCWRQAAASRRYTIPSPLRSCLQHFQVGGSALHLHLSISQFQHTHTHTHTHTSDTTPPKSTKRPNRASPILRLLTGTGNTLYGAHLKGILRDTRTCRMRNQLGSFCHHFCQNDLHALQTNITQNISEPELFNVPKKNALPISGPREPRYLQGTIDACSAKCAVHFRLNND
jgi:hypothetical protein